MQIRTGTARSGDLDIYYEDMGDPNDPAVLLIMGLGAQLLLWRTEFCEKLVDQGLRVIRYDNRDVGLSTKVTGRHTGAPLAPRMVRSFLGLRSQAVYTLEDVADDAAALLDHLKIDTAHIVGASMGGMIAQVFAARHKVRTKTLAIIFSSNNQPLLPPPGPRQLLAILQKPKDATREAIIDNADPSIENHRQPRLSGSRRSASVPRRSRATTGRTTPLASAAISRRSSAAGACFATTGWSASPPL